MTRAEALAKLDLLEAESRSVRSIRAAWARKARVIHPDTAPEVVAEAAANLAQLNKARDLLLVQATNGDTHCGPCRGTGQVRRRFGAVKCDSCGGTGDKR